MCVTTYLCKNIEVAPQMRFRRTQKKRSRRGQKQEKTHAPCTRDIFESAGGLGPLCRAAAADMHLPWDQAVQVYITP